MRRRIQRARDLAEAFDAFAEVAARTGAEVEVTYRVRVDGTAYQTQAAREVR